MSSTSRKISFSSSLIVEQWRDEHQVQFPSSYRCPLRMQVGQFWHTRGGRKMVTKAMNRKLKTRTAKTLGEEPFSVWKTKPKRRRRLPPITAVTVQASLQCCTMFRVHCSLVINPKTIEKSCSNSFSGFVFQVFRTQRSSASVTISVFKQKEQKVALGR